jgi:hypothetical protein
MGTARTALINSRPAPEGDRWPQSTERSMPASVVPPLTIECVLCGNKMVLIGVEQRAQQTVCTYQCINEHLQELAIGKR